MSGAGSDDSQGRPPAAEAETELGSFESAAARPVALPSAVTQLSNAASIAAMLLTTETLIVEKPAEEDEHAGHSH